MIFVSINPPKIEFFAKVDSAIDDFESLSFLCYSLPSSKELVFGLTEKI